MLQEAIYKFKASGPMLLPELILPFSTIWSHQSIRCSLYMNSMSLFLFAVSVAAVFYPSERVLHLKSHPEAINNPKDLLALIIRNYY